MGFTYEKAGVSVGRNEKFVEMIRKLVEDTWPDGGKEIGGFAGGGIIPSGTTMITAAVDGVGTKTQIVSSLKNYKTIGIDAVAMSAMDVYVNGGIPVFLYDYLVVKKLIPDLHIDIIRGVIKGCLQAGCRLIGGETAEHPFNCLPKNYFDIATFCVGFYKSNTLPEIHSIKAGMKVYGWLSYGLSSNGYSLVREVFNLDHKSRTQLRWLEPALNKSLGRELLKPTKIYIKDIERIRLNKECRVVIKTHAHITGGGLVGNIPRILPKDYKVVLDRSTWERPPIFSFIQKKGQIPESEMDKVFNQGVQVVTIVAMGEIEHPDCRLIGVVERRKKNEPQVQFNGKFQE